MKKILFSWIGHADLNGSKAEELSGPLVSVLASEHYDVLFMVYNQPESELSNFIARIQETYPCEIQCKTKHLSSPIHFGDIYTAFDSVMQEAKEKFPNSEFTIQLSSGTPAMSAVSILLGKSKYFSRFVQSSREQGVQEADIPFDIAADFLPSLAEQNDSKLKGLIAGMSPDTAAFKDIITQNPQMEKLKQQAAVVAQRDLPVLIYGETGTGKELFAKAIHNTSPRSHKALVSLNCGAIPKDLIDTTLFGHAKGAFTGATHDTAGYFEQADGGTLFLDEFGELPLESQVRLLRVLEDGIFKPVGSTKEIKVNVRIITATNKNLIDEIAEGRFREDLFYRVAIGVLNLPPLRDRKGDLPVLANSLMDRINLDAGSQPGYEHKKISVKGRNFINSHTWPGNVRELNATLLRASLWHTGKSLSAEDIKNAVIQSKPKSEQILGLNINQEFDINEIIKKVSVHYIERALAETNGSKTKSAEILGIKNYQTLSNWIEKYDVK